LRAGEEVVVVIKCETLLVAQPALLGGLVVYRSSIAVILHLHLLLSVVIVRFFGITACLLQRLPAREADSSGLGLSSRVI